MPELTSLPQPKDVDLERLPFLINVEP
jgi:hypothetical protein